VMKKLAALSLMHEEEFEHYFEFKDLVMDQWNDVDTLEVMPVFSPHPVETTVLFFRTLDRSGYRSYAHLADISSLRQLRGMITDDDTAPGLSKHFFDTVAANYLQPVDLKKIDIGGGMIHGDAEDFAQDQSAKIVLAHTAQGLTTRQKQIGSGAPFGTVDVLVPSHQDYIRSYAFHYLESYFPDIPRSRLRVLMNNPISKFNPESIILKARRKADCVYLLLTGQVEMIQTKQRVYSSLSSGAMLGEITALTGKPVAETYRASNFVLALRIPLDLYLTFVKNNGLHEQMMRLSDVRTFLYTNRLFGDSVSSMRHTAIAAAVSSRCYVKGEIVARPQSPCLSLVLSGKVELAIGDKTVERLKPGDFFCESTVLFDIPCLYRSVASTDVTIYTIPAPVLADIPIIRWKLLEVYETRLNKAVSLDVIGPALRWREEYCTNIPVLDKEHQELFLAAKHLYHSLFNNPPQETPESMFEMLLATTLAHFASEEGLMRSSGYPGLKAHTKVHQELFADLKDFAKGFSTMKQSRRKEVSGFFRDSLLTHIFTEDRKLGTYLKAQGQAPMPHRAK
jgi:hemerythrin